MTDRAAEQETIEFWHRALKDHEAGKHRGNICQCGVAAPLLAAIQRRDDELAEVKADRKDILKERAGLFSEITARYKAEGEEGRG